MYPLSFILLALSTGSALAAPSIEPVSTYRSAFTSDGLVRRGATYAEVCGQNRIAHCCGDLEKNRAHTGSIPVGLIRCSKIDLLSELVHASCNGQVCCGGPNKLTLWKKGLVNLPCPSLQL
ncbi:hypothetical protein CP532_1334 [Ophiocordyceps camponoti-leonardi (nom. inval.)]|nr:hypothetical protein CP532_1334 [Ophiocordyceps camponoti-leonardi (nom. inval.)]